MRLGLRRLVLLAPARDLARDVAARPAEVGEAERRVVDGMQAGQHVELRLVDRQPALLRHLGQQRIPQHAAVAIFHDVEGGADHAVVLAQRIGRGRRHVGLVQRRNHAEFAVDRMGRRQQLARRLAAQHVAAAGAVGQAIGRVGLTTLELLDRERRREARDVRGHEAGEPLLVEAMLLLHRHRADVVRAFSRHPKPLLNDCSLCREFARPCASTCNKTDRRRLSRALPVGFASAASSAWTAARPPTSAAAQGVRSPSAMRLAAVTQSAQRIARCRLVGPAPLRGRRTSCPALHLLAALSRRWPQRGGAHAAIRAPSPATVACDGGTRRPMRWAMSRVCVAALSLRSLSRPSRALVDPVRRAIAIARSAWRHRIRLMGLGRNG